MVDDQKKISRIVPLHDSAVIEIFFSRSFSSNLEKN